MIWLKEVGEEKRMSETAVLNQGTCGIMRLFMPLPHCGEPYLPCRNHDDPSFRPAREVQKLIAKQCVYQKGRDAVASNLINELSTMLE